MQFNTKGIDGASHSGAGARTLRRTAAQSLEASVLVTLQTTGLFEPIKWFVLFSDCMDNLSGTAGFHLVSRIFLEAGFVFR